MTTYTVGSLFTAVILISAFLKDSSTANTDRRSWAIVFLGASLWFAVLPFIIRKKLLGMKQTELATIAH